MEPSVAIEACVICHWLDQQAWGAFENYLPTVAAGAVAAGAAAGAAYRDYSRRALDGFRNMRGGTDGAPYVRGVRPVRGPRTTPLELNEIADSYEGLTPDERLDYFTVGLGRPELSSE